MPPTIHSQAYLSSPALVAEHNLGRYIPTFAYEVDQADAPVSYLPGTLPWGAYHGAGGESSSEGLTADQAALAAQVTTEWVGYARTDNPTVPGAPLWTRYTHARPQVMSLVSAGDSALVPTSTLVAQHNCGFWDAVTHTPRK